MSDPIGCWPLNEPIPVVLRDRDLMKVLGLQHSAYGLRKKAGAFEFLKLRPQPAGGYTLYSGRLVEQWVRGELGESRYFQGARRRA